VPSPFLSRLPAPTQPSTLSLHDALPIFANVSWVEQAALGHRHEVLVAHPRRAVREGEPHRFRHDMQRLRLAEAEAGRRVAQRVRSEEHTSELQSPDHLVCRLLLEKKNSE